MTILGLRNRTRGLGISPRRHGRPQAATPPSIVQDGLVAEWRFSAGSGQVVTDHAGGHHGQIGSTTGSDTNDPTWATGGLQFDGVDNYVRTSTWQFPSPDFHVDIVGRFTGTAGGTDFVAAFGTTFTGAADDDTCPFLVFRDGTNAGIICRIGDGTGSTISDPSVGTVFDDGWHHLSFDYDQSANQLTIAVDGTEFTDTMDSRVPNVATQATLFGIWHNLSILPASMIMGYCTVYNRVLSTEEKAAQRTALAAIMAARGIALP